MGFSYRLNGWRDPYDRDCVECEASLQCRWLQHCEDVATRPDNDLPVLSRMLEQSVSHVQDLVRDWGHNSFSCRCETCQWLRKVRRTCLDSERLLEQPPGHGLRLPQRASNAAHFWPGRHH